MTDTPRPDEDAVASLDKEFDADTTSEDQAAAPAAEPDAPAEPAKEEPAPAAEVPVSTPPESEMVEDAPVQLSRIFSLLGLIGAIISLGGLLAVYNLLEERIHSTEIGASTSRQIIETRVNAVSEGLERELAASRGAGAKIVVLGGELSRTLYLMNALATDKNLPNEARQKAQAAHDATAALLTDLQKLE